MKSIVTLAALIIGLFAVFLGFTLLKPSPPKTQEEVNFQLQLDSNKQQHEIALRDSELDHQLSVNQQKFDHEAQLKKQQAENDAILQQYQMQHNLGIEQSKLAHEAVIEQQKNRKEVEIRQLDLNSKVAMQREELASSNQQKMMELEHEVALKRQQEAVAQQRIYLLFAGGIVLIIVFAGVILVLVRNFKEAQIQLRNLEQSREFQLEEGRNMHEMRMKALDIMASFPAEERKDVILEVMNIKNPSTPPKVLNPADDTYNDSSKKQPQMEEQTAQKTTNSKTSSHLDSETETNDALAMALASIDPHQAASDQTDSKKEADPKHSSQEEEPKNNNLENVVHLQDRNNQR